MQIHKSVNSPSTSAYPEDRLARLLLEKSGFVSILQRIVDDIEEDIAGQYEAIEDEDGDGSTPSYGGNVYTSYSLVDDYKPSYLVSKRISDEQRKVLDLLCDEGDFEISVCRNDRLRHKYSFALSVPNVPNKPEGERFFLYIEMEFSMYDIEEYELIVTHSDDLSSKDLDKFLLLYSLAL